MLTKSMRSLVKILENAQQWAVQNGKSEDDLLQSRLAPDMFPLVKQVQLVSDSAKGVASRLSGIEIPSYEDTEVAIFELIDRLNRTIEFVEAIPAENFDNAEGVKITMPRLFPGKYMTSSDYLSEHGLPNFYFHVVTAYAILRNAGMPLGKSDYINGLNLMDLE